MLVLRPEQALSAIVPMISMALTRFSAFLDPGWPKRERLCSSDDRMPVSAQKSGNFYQPQSGFRFE
ncbi:hypothetical protein P2T68_09425 [Pseudomonas sp. G11]|uniref:hypothetical protein n=1 Tax=Pseudomonas sp. G11 TaxID=528343 RepID=UPI002402BD12|nr:hypothetical protein [Pseudomonas sp. G11]WEX17523.1 hypothetical protein P2T68_09425 [Pseudomonas sp. G11]